MIDLEAELAALDEKETVDAWLSRVDLDPEGTLRAQQGVAFSALVQLDGRPVCRVEQRGDDKLSVWRTTRKGGRWSAVVAFRDQLETSARVYFHLEDGAADALVASLVAGARNGAQAALRWRTLSEKSYVNGEPCDVRSWPARRAQARYQRHRWTCEACAWGHGDDCSEAASLRADWTRIEPETRGQPCREP